MRLNVEQVKNEIENKLNGCKVLEIKYDSLHDYSSLVVELSNGKKKYMSFVGKEASADTVSHFIHALNRENIYTDSDYYVVDNIKRATAINYMTGEKYMKINNDGKEVYTFKKTKNVIDCDKLIEGFMMN